MNYLKKGLVVFGILFSVAIYAQHQSFKVDITGKGNPILLFPGFSCPGEVFNDLVSELSKTNECHVFTFAGFGDAPPVEKPWLPKIKDELTSYILDKNLKNVTLIGHSLGGTLSLWLGTESNLNIKKIISIDALPSAGALMIPNYDSASIVYDNPYNKQILEMNDEAFSAMAQQIASGMVLNKERKGIIHKWICDTDRETYVYGYTDLLKLDLRESIKSIKAPVTILAAIQPFGIDAVKNTYKSQYEKLTNYTIKYAEKSAHFIMYDQPEWLLNAIKIELN